MMRTAFMVFAAAAFAWSGLAAQEAADPPAEQPAGPVTPAPPSFEGIDWLTEGAQEPDRVPETVVLRALDKITARFTDIEAPLSAPIRFGSLEILPRTCNKRPPEETPETAAFLEIYDYGLKGFDDTIADDAEKKQLFMGWMFASSPALNPLEHAVYDVWVIDCIMSAPETVEGNE
ncbi:MAG: DUF2155 domain-containing protein [Pseudomonadota bacterium]